MPQYEEISRLDTSQLSHRFRASLGDLYSGLLDFLQAVIRLFAQRNGSMVMRYFFMTRIRSFFPRTEENTYCHRSITVATVRCTVSQLPRATRVSPEGSTS